MPPESGPRRRARSSPSPPGCAALGLSAPEICAADPAPGLVLLEDLGDDLFAPLCAADPAREAGALRAPPSTCSPTCSGRAAAGADAGLDAAALRPRLPDARGAAGRRSGTCPPPPARPPRRTSPPSSTRWSSRSSPSRRRATPPVAGAARLPRREPDLAARARRATPGSACSTTRTCCSATRPTTSSRCSRTPAATSRPALRAGDARALPRPQRRRPARPSPRRAHALAAQRNLKILGLFTRLARRDGKPRYLRHLPRVWAHLQRDLAHPDARAARRLRAARRAAGAGRASPRIEAAA